MKKQTNSLKFLNIEDLPLSSPAVTLLKSKNILTTKDLKHFDIKVCQSAPEEIVNEICEIIKPYLEILVTDPNSALETIKSRDSAQDGKAYSPFLKEELTQDELRRASRLLSDLSVVRFKAMIAKLKSMNIETVADILKVKPEKILRLKGIGRTRFDELVFSVQKVVFGNKKLEERAPASESLLGRRLSEQEKELLGDISIESVVDDVRARKIFQKLKIKTVVAAAGMNRDKFFNTRNAGRKSVLKVIESIEEIIKELSKNHEIQLDEVGIKHIIENHMLARLPDEQVMILRDRHGLWDGVIETLEDIGHKFNRTRERVRQIQSSAEGALCRMLVPRLFATRLIARFRLIAHEKLQRNFEGLANLDDLENVIFNIDKEALVADLAYKMLKDIYYPNSNPLAEGLVQCTEKVVAKDNNIKQKFERICEAVELVLVSKGKPQSPEELVLVVSKSVGMDISASFMKRCADVDVSSRIGLDKFGKVGLKRWSYFNAQNIEHMAQTALIELGVPSHYSLITGQMNVMFPHRAPFNERSVHGRITNHPELFAWAGKRGTYALVNWGIKRYPSIKDFLAQELQAAGRPLSEEELVSRGAAKYDYRAQSIRMTLYMQKRIFKKLPDGLYALK